MVREVLSESGSARMRVAKGDLEKARKWGAKYHKADWQIVGEALVLWGETYGEE